MFKLKNLVEIDVKVLLKVFPKLSFDKDYTVKSHIFSHELIIELPDSGAGTEYETLRYLTGLSIVFYYQN